jgi:hypothetical protein
MNLLSEKNISMNHRMFLKTGALAFSMFTISALPGYSVYAQQTQQVNSVILDDSKLTINGTSNVNDFECIYDEEFEEDTLSHTINIDEAIAEVEGEQLVLVVDSFDCGKRGINRDFRNTLKSDVYPTIELDLKKVIRVPGEPISAEVDITLAGVTKSYLVEFGEVKFYEEGFVEVLGTQPVQMSDFGIEPPRALFGLIKVNDELDINFTLRIIQ